MLNRTVVTSRRHCLSRTFGDVTPASLVEALRAAPADPTSPAGFSVVGVEVWSAVARAGDIGGGFDAHLRNNGDDF